MELELHSDLWFCGDCGAKESHDMDSLIGLLRFVVLLV